MYMPYQTSQHEGKLILETSNLEQDCSLKNNYDSCFQYCYSDRAMALHK